MASPVFMVLFHCKKCLMIASATPKDWSIRGRHFSMLCVNRILIICDLSSFDRLLFLTARISLILVMSFIESVVFVPSIAKNTCNG